MNVGIIGSGRIGGTLGVLWARAGHGVLFSGSRDPGKLRRLAETAGGNARPGTPIDAAGFGEVVMLAPPWWAMNDALAEAGAFEGSMDGKVVVDAGNPFAEGWVPLSLPDGASSARETAEKVPRARLVKAFNTLRAEVLAGGPSRPPGERLALPLAGDDPAAKETVAGLISDAGFVPVDVGPLSRARLLDHGSPLHNHPMGAREARAILEALEEREPEIRAGGG
jgi:predicted dinucleotide-binding enzyme